VIIGGAGKTGCAAVLERFRFVGIDTSAEYLHIARARIAHWQKTVERDKPTAHRIR
jgi:DNA modification methylase